VLDIGANIGVYTLNFSKLVGPEGHVFAFEPMPDTFGFLCYNVMELQLRNVSLFNVAVSSQPGLVMMDLPTTQSGMQGHYEAKISGEGKWPVWALNIDGLSLSRKISLVKIDVEGHEIHVLKGMRGLLDRDRPRILFEAQSDAAEYLTSIGYTVRREPNSPNQIAEFV